MAKIKDVVCREILDSRGNPTLETKVFLEDGSVASSSIPSGASRGKFEALELRDNDPFRYRGRGVLKAVDNVNKGINSLIKGLEAGNQEELDMLMINSDGTPNKSNFGANAILSVSQAVCEAQAVSLKLPNYQYIYQIFKQKFGKDYTLLIPKPTFNLINGGKHGAGNNLNFQEFHIIPSSLFAYDKALMTAASIYQFLGMELQQVSSVFSVGDEGGYAPNFKTNKAAIEFLVNAGIKAGFKYKEDFLIGIDVAANNFFSNGTYSIIDFGKPVSPQELMMYYVQLKEYFNIYTLEDPFAEEEWENWSLLNVKLPEVMIIGDDLLCTNAERIKKAIEIKACNAVLIKPNQVGTISETFAAIITAKKAGLKTIVSHRSGETNEDFIADFAVGVGADMVKFGAPARGERVAKYNRLLEIEKEISVSNT